GVLVLSSTAQKSNELTVRYNSPAYMWEETLPLENGRIDMMPDGAVDKELEVLNDISMCSGSEEHDALKLTAFDHLDEIRKLLLSGKNMDAQNLMYAHFRSGGLGSAFGKGKDAPYGCFQMLGNMHIRYMYPQSEETVNYQRKLSLNDAVRSEERRVGKESRSRGSASQ